MVENSSLLNCRIRKGLASSNLALSALKIYIKNKKTLFKKYILLYASMHNRGKSTLITMAHTHEHACCHIPKYRHKPIFIAILTTTIILVSIFFIIHKKDTTEENCGQDYALLDQHIDCKTINEKIIRVKALEIDVSRLIEQKKQKGDIEEGSVFYRDLKTRRWFGINADKNFYPASLLKLPIAIAYYKLAETNPDILKKEIAIPPEQPDQNAKQYFAVKSNIQPGKSYTIEEMIKNLLKNSDNNPIYALNQNLPAEYSYNVLRDLGLPEPHIYNGKSNWDITVRLYAGILRSLYIASYLTPPYSEELLRYLSESTFAYGIRAVIPAEITIAHKFGEAALLNPDGSIETRVLHDCGIVYDPESPYIICIMTSGNNIEKMIETIQDITKIVSGSIIPNVYDNGKINLADDE